MTPEQEGQLFQDLGYIKAEVSNLSATMVEHTKADAENFKALDARLDSIEKKLTVDETSKAAAAGVAKKKAGIWAAVWAAAISALFQGAYWFMTKGN